MSLASKPFRHLQDQVLVSSVPGVDVLEDSVKNTKRPGSTDSGTKEINWINMSPAPTYLQWTKRGRR